MKDNNLIENLDELFGHYLYVRKGLRHKSRVYYTERIYWYILGVGIEWRWGRR